jgi:hypothetical protein
MTAKKCAVFTLIAIALYAGVFGNRSHAFAAEPMKYPGLVENAKRFWESAEQRDVIVSWNPKAPGFAVLQMNVVIDVHDGKVIVYSGSREHDQVFAAYFDEEGALIADGHLHTLASLPPFDPRDGAATTGLPAELLAVRLLTLANTIPVLATFDLKEPRRLQKADERLLAQAIYPDTPALAEAPGKLHTTLRSSTDNGTVKYEWFDVGGTIFQVEIKACTDELLAASRKEFEWTAIPSKKLPVPRVATLLEHLIGGKVIDAIEGDAVAFGKNGARQSDSVDDRETISMELVRFRMAEHVGAITVSRAAPLRVKDVKAIEDTNGDTIGRTAVVADVEDTRVLSLDGQDWLITVAVPGVNSGSVAARKVVAEVERWLWQVRMKQDSE